MDASPKMYIEDEQFGQYVDELHEFSDSHRVPYGKPQDLARLLESLKTAPAFEADFGSMIRSIVLREHFQIPESELVTLVAVAWGGEKADDPNGEVAFLLTELLGVLQDLLRRGALGSMKPEPSAPVLRDEPKEIPAADVHETIRELEQASPDVQMYRQLIKLQNDRNGQPASPRQESKQRELPEAPERYVPRGDSSGSRRIPQLRPLADPPPRRESGGRTAAPLFSYSSPDSRPAEPVRLEPAAAEIIATGLTGLVVALLFTVASLPIYRSRVSISLPATGSQIATDASTALRSGDVTRRTAERLLAESHSNPILRQDALSRGLRDLDIGGKETILYADLVAETARLVKVTPLAEPNVYEITCDSWSSQFAETFCDEFLATLQDEPAQQGAESSRTIDAAVGPGIQIFPHWYLQGLGGLAAGCLAGVLVGFIKRPGSDGTDDYEEEAR